jgi:histone acetyltransferase (RNA polymerase elongator complex component)
VNESDSTHRPLPKGINDPDEYEWDEDGHPREIVGAWSALHKHELLRRYIDISGVGVRRNWLKKGTAGATYIDRLS